MRKKQASAKVLAEIAALGAKYSDNFQRQEFTHADDPDGEGFEMWVDTDRSTDDNPWGQLSDAAYEELMAQRADAHGEDVKKRRRHEKLQKQKSGKGGGKAQKSVSAATEDQVSDSWVEDLESLGQGFNEGVLNWTGQTADIAEAEAAAAQASADSSAAIAESAATETTAKAGAVVGVALVLGLIFLATRRSR